MTIALGMLVPDTRDLIVAADTQETYLDAKVEGQKVMSLHVTSVDGGPLGTVVFTGAGSAGYLDALGQEILRVFLDEDHLVGVGLRAAFERAIVRFYRRHVIPFGETWAQNDHLPVSSLIAYQRGANGHGLFSSTMTALKETSCAAVGTGQVLALSVLHRLRKPGIPIEAALRLAAYGVFLAKERDPYCGKHTHIALLSGNEFHQVDPAIVEQWEFVFRAMEVRDTVSTAVALGIRTLVAPEELQRRRLVEPLAFAPSGVTPKSSVAASASDPEAPEVSTHDPTDQPPSRE